MHSRPIHKLRFQRHGTDYHLVLHTEWVAGRKGVTTDLGRWQDVTPDQIPPAMLKEWDLLCDVIMNICCAGVDTSGSAVIRANPFDFRAMVREIWRCS